MFKKIQYDYKLIFSNEYHISFCSPRLDSFQLYLEENDLGEKKIVEINNSSELIKRRPVTIGLIYLFAIISSSYQVIQPKPGKAHRKNPSHEQVPEKNMDHILSITAMHIYIKMHSYLLRYENLKHFYFDLIISIQRQSDRRNGEKRICTNNYKNYVW